MFGFFFGALCLLGMAYVLRRPSLAHGGGWHRGWHGPAGRRGSRWPAQDSWGGGRGGGLAGSGRAQFVLRWVNQRLGTSPAQEAALADAAEAMAGAAESFRGEWEQSRGDLARAMRAEPFDAETLRTAFARHDERIALVREVLVTQGTRVHEVLDGRQRAALADLLERAPGRGRWNV
jgi:hypothetical protein